MDIKGLSDYFDDKNVKYIPTGVPELDSMIDGYYEGSVILVGGWPGMGKTTLGINLVTKLPKTPILIYTTGEVSKFRYMEKLLCCLSTVKDKDVRIKDAVAITKIKNSVHCLDDYNLYISDKSGPNIKDIENDIKLFKPRIVIIDYFQNLEIPGGLNRYAEYTNLARGLEKLAEKYGNTMVLMSQLKKPDIQKGKMPRPTKFDFKETGKLGEMARVAILLSHLDEEDEDKELFVDIQKARDGQIGSFKIKGEWEYNRLL